MEYGQLTLEEKEGLKGRHGQEGDRRICDRIKAVLMYDSGYTLEEIGKVLLLSHEGIRKHIKDYHAFNKLKTCNGGSLSKLSKQQENELTAHLEHNSYVHARHIAVYIQDK